MPDKHLNNPYMKKKLIAGRDTPLSECFSEEEVEWDAKTRGAMEETERLLADPNTKYYTDVEEILRELKR